MQRESIEERQAVQQAVLSEIRRDWDRPREELLEQMAAALHERFQHYTGVYIYLLEGDTLLLAAFRGRPTEHTRIPIEAGICGRAARIQETVTVDDVNGDPEYIACSLETRSEIVVPIMREGQVFGEIDIDSDIPAAFTQIDREFLERLADLIQQKF